MPSSKDDFEKWFITSMAPLRRDGNAGFIFALVAFPLLERYLRNKSSCPEGEPLKPQFFTALGEMFSEILGKQDAFWDCYRNGLLHQVTFPKAKLNKKGIWVNLPPAGLSGHDLRPIYFHQTFGAFFLNPLEFFTHVTKTIWNDFGTFEQVNPATQYSLPTIINPGTVQPGTTPTISGLPLSSGSYNLPPPKSSP
jgi:hypothetical protein